MSLVCETKEKASKTVSIRLTPNEFDVIKKYGLSASELLKEAIKTKDLKSIRRRQHASKELVSFLAIDSKNDSKIGNFVIENAKNANNDITSQMYALYARFGASVIRAFLKQSLIMFGLDQSLSKSEFNAIIDKFFICESFINTLSERYSVMSDKLVEFTNGDITLKVSSITELLEALNGLNISTPAQFANKPVKESITAWYQSNNDVFYDYCHYYAKKKVSEGTYGNYARALATLNTVYTPDDLINYERDNGKRLSEKHIKGIYKLFSSMQDSKDVESFNGYTFTQWKRKLLNAETNEGSRLDSIALNIPLDDLETWYYDTIDSAKPFLWMLVMSGCRIITLRRFLALSEFERKKLIDVVNPSDPETKRKYGTQLKNTVLRVNCKKFSSGNKNEYYLYFPYSHEAEKMLLTYEPLKNIKSKHMLDKHITPFELNQTQYARGKLEYSPKTLRKFFSNELILNKVPQTAVERLTGKKPSSVLAGHYLDLDDFAAIEYAKIQNHLSKLLKFPKFN